VNYAASLLCVFATQAAAFDCTLQDIACTTDCAQVSVRFEIDTAQFAAAQNSADPPRRQITTVTMDGATFVAQAIMMPNNVRGFHEDAGEIGSRLMIVQRDGSARLSLQPSNTTLTGQCTQP
jgi:hypothetical protein